MVESRAVADFEEVGCGRLIERPASLWSRDALNKPWYEHRVGLTWRCGYGIINDTGKGILRSGHPVLCRECAIRYGVIW